MIEAIAGVCRWMVTICSAVIIGTTLFRYFCLRDLGRDKDHRETRSERILLLVSAVLLFLFHVGSLAGQYGALGDRALTLDGWVQFIFGTHAGRVWIWRAAVAILVVPTAFLARFDSPRHTIAICLLVILIVLYIGLGSWAGHAAGAENLVAALLLNMSHHIAVALWVGALPMWMITVHRFSHRHAEYMQSNLFVALMRFSHLATGLMIVIVVSGTLMAGNYIETEGDLFGTRYGELLLFKLALLCGVLLYAQRLRLEFLPALRSEQDVAQIFPRALRHVGAEMGFAFAMIGCAVCLSQTTPAAHDTAHWWMPFRLSLDATWADKSMRIWILGASGGISVASLVMILGRNSRAQALALLATLANVGILLWALAVPAYPDTFRRADVPYLTVSIAAGRELYEAHCTSCHGGGGLGDGPLARSLPRTPANLSQPHTALHTAGDMYWWIGHGIPKSGMPGFEKLMTSDDRWDAVNFLRAFSQGFEARILRPQIIPGQPWLGAPNFYIEQAVGPTELKGYRDTQNILLVLFKGLAAKDRLVQLAKSQGQLARLRTTVLVVADAEISMPDDLPFTVIHQGSAPIWASYELLMRTVANRGSPDRLGMEWQHAEFLIDRFGFVRARWIAGADSNGWESMNELYPQIEKLNVEPRLKPPPDDHVH